MTARFIQRNQRDDVPVDLLDAGGFQQQSWSTFTMGVSGACNRPEIQSVAGFLLEIKPTGDRLREYPWDPLMSGEFPKRLIRFSF